MEINPRKMDFDKMKPSKNSNGEIDANQAKSIDSVNNGARYNPAPSFTPPANPSPISNLDQPMASLKKPTELLSEAWELYKARWKTFLGIVVAPVLLMIFAGMIFFVGLWGSGMMDKSFPESFFDNIIAPSVFLVLLFIFFVLIIIIQIWSQAALIYAIKESEDIGIKKAYQKSKSKIKPFFWVSLLVGFIIMGGLVLFFIPAFIFTTRFIFTSPIVIMGGLIPFAIPGIIFAVWFSFATFIVITEDLKGMNAILKSREYVRNYWWAVLWRFLFMYIVLIGVMIVASVALILIPILGNLVSIALTPLIMIYLFLIYNNLRKVKGDFEFRPSAKAKKSFIAVGALGIIAIPLLFGSIVLVSLNNARDNARDAKRFSDLKQIEVEMLMYYNKQGEYPKSLNELNVEYTDPETKEPYEYHQLDNGDDYEVCAVFQNGRQCFSSEDSEDSAWDDKETSEDTIKNRDKQRIFDLYSISKMLKRYEAENGIYPVSRISVKLNENNQITRKIRSANEDIDIPVDPNDPKYYYSYKSPNGKSFEIAARLENLEDKDCEIINNMCIYKISN